MSKTSILQPAGWAEVAWLVVLSSTWGSSFTLIKIAIQAWDPLPLAGYRLILAALLFLALFIAIGSMKKRWLHWRQQPLTVWLIVLVIACFGNIVPFTLIGWGEMEVDSTLAAIIVASMPIWALIFAHILTDDEKMTWVRVIGIILGLVGVGILLWPKIDASNAGLVPLLALLLAAISYGLAAAIARKAVQLSALDIVALSTIAAATIMIPILLSPYFYSGSLTPLLGTPDSIVHALQSGKPLIAAIALSVLCTFASGIIFFSLLKKSGAIFTAQCNYLIPFFAALWGYLFLDERLSIEVLIAISFVIGGIILTRRL